MFSKYVENLFGLNDTQYRLRGGTKALTGVNQVVYDRMVPMIQSVASGRTTSTEFFIDLSLSDLGLQKANWTAQELGVSALLVNGSIPDSVHDAAYRLVGFDPGIIVETLMYNHPYEMYWYDKGGNGSYYPCSYSALGNVIESNGRYYYSFEGCRVRIALLVAPEFGADAGNGQFYVYITKPDMATSAINAANRARSIVKQYASAPTNYEKLDGYRSEICSLVSYNTVAWNNHQAQQHYGNPWQLVWVFDGDPNTRVVCEGYAKAFQYLCDQSDFKGDVSCISVSGYADAGDGFDGHMWNIVRMPDGKNYLADITGCDARSNKDLFMAGYSSKPTQGRYVFDVPSGRTILEYHDSMFNLYPSSRLEISNTSFNTNPSGVRINADQFPDAVFRAHVSQWYDSDGNGVLSSAEIASVQSIGVSYKDIQSLKGIEYFTALEALDCSGNLLTTLDISRNTALDWLECADNQLTSLNVRSNTLLEHLDCRENRIVSLDISRCPTLVKNRRNTSYLKYDSNVVLVTGIASQGISIDATNFPDAAFRAYIAQNFDWDADDGLSKSEIEWVTDISVSGLGIASLKGIEHFPKLEYLWCDGNQLTSLDISRNTALEYLDCSNNALTSLNVGSCRALQTLYCSENQLSALNLYNNAALKGVEHFAALEELQCGGNQLTALDVTRNAALRELGCSFNQLSGLDVSHNPAVETLYCDSNQLSSLDVSQNPALKALVCGENPLNALDITRNTALELLDCNKNQLSSLDLSQNIALKYLNCTENRLAELDVSHNTALETLMCGRNRLSTLDVSQNPGLTRLTFYENQIRRMDVSNCPEVLNDSITQLFLRYATHVHLITGAEAAYTVLTLPAGLTEIGEDAFSGIAADAVEIPTGCSSIAANAFADCPNLKEVRFPASAAPEIDPLAFNGKVTLVTDSPSVQAWAQANNVKWVYDLG